jgi:hypothetical protein
MGVTRKTALASKVGGESGRGKSGCIRNQKREDGMKFRKSRFPAYFEVNPRIMELAKQNNWPDPWEELEAFRDHHLAKGSLFVDWEAAFRTWLRNAAKYGRSAPVRTPEPKPIRRREDRPKESGQFDPKINKLLVGLINKLAVK